MTFKFERFETWKRAIEFANAMFEVADALPQKYQFSLGEQLRRAALSVPTNLAEGSGRASPKEERYFYGSALKPESPIRRIHSRMSVYRQDIATTRDRQGKDHG